CSLNGQPASCAAGSGRLPYAGLAGAQPAIFTITATDAIGNARTLTRSWTVDDHGPPVAVTTPNDYGVGLSCPTVALSFTLDVAHNPASDPSYPDADATFECNVDSQGWAPCTSPDTVTLALNAQHTFAVRATDRYGNLGAPTAIQWYVGRVSSALTIQSP